MNRTRDMRSRRFSLAPLGAALTVGLVVLAGSRLAWGIVGGEPDGDGHPHVGAIVVVDPDSGEPSRICSGALIHERVFLTAGHCGAFILEGVEAGDFSMADVFVTFDPDDAFDPTHHLAVEDAFGIFIFHAFQGFDVGALILEDPVLDREPATLAPPGFLDEKTRLDLRRGEWRTVGYGLRSDNFPPPGGEENTQRLVATPEFLGFVGHGGYMVFQQNPSAGNSGGCGGDSGGPLFWVNPDGEEILVAVESLGNIVNFPHYPDSDCISTGFPFRIDIADAAAFIEEVLASVDD